MVLKEMHKRRIIKKFGKNVMDYIAHKLKGFKEWLMASML
jgi:hypothetical protein